MGEGERWGVRVVGCCGDLRAKGWEVMGERCSVMGVGWKVRNEKWQRVIRSYKRGVKGVHINITTIMAESRSLLIIILNTCGTHLGDTKLVASIDERPVSDSISINLILVSVATTAYKEKRIMQLWTIITTVTCISLHTWKDWNIWSAKSIFAEPGRLGLAIVNSQNIFQTFPWLCK